MWAVLHSQRARVPWRRQISLPVETVGRLLARESLLQLKIGTKENPVDGLTKTVGRVEQESLREFLQRGKRLLARRATCVYTAGRKNLHRVVPIYYLDESMKGCHTVA
jgi:hypothetical protein